jgi:hypothetical protein
MFIGLKQISIIKIQALARSEPHTAIPILKGTLNHIVRQSIPLGKIVKPWKKKISLLPQMQKKNKKEKITVQRLFVFFVYVHPLS